MDSTVVMTMAGHYSNPKGYFTIRIRPGSVARNEMEGGYTQENANVQNPPHRTARNN